MQRGVQILGGMYPVIGSVVEGIYVENIPLDAMVGLKGGIKLLLHVNQVGALPDGRVNVYCKFCENEQWYDLSLVLGEEQAEKAQDKIGDVWELVFPFEIVDLYDEYTESGLVVRSWYGHEFRVSRDRLLRLEIGATVFQKAYLDTEEGYEAYQTLRKNELVSAE
ncbi:hypothetical protein [Bacillus cereus]|uniref:hypothetical protein n=1 Tax=Bacillus cereus TaxID=1396 RepID=UPI001C8B3F21|nr:hypothetical protein [Bacillus cereus]MBX9158334.1 hypothetical protein [Bacillus cereus]